MERKILSSNIKETPVEILSGMQGLSDYCFGEDKAFQDNLNKFDAQLFYVLEENRLLAFLATCAIKPNNEYVKNVLDQSSLKEEKKKEILYCGSHAFLYVIALNPEVQKTGLSFALNKAAEKHFSSNNIDNLLVFAWQYNGRAAGANVLDKSGYKNIGTADKPWQAKCDSGQLVCSHRTENLPGKCDCIAIICEKNGRLR